MSDPVFRVRASSWARLLDCAYAWEWEQLLGHKGPTSPRALLGSAFHAGTAAFDAAVLAQRPISTSDAADVVIETIANPQDEVNWRADKELKRRDVEAIALNLTTTYCTTWSPQFTFEAVEFPLKEPVSINLEGITLELVGTLDRMRVVREHAEVFDVRSGEDRSITKRQLIDLKSGRRAVYRDEQGVPHASTKGHRPQLGTYELLYEARTGVLLDLPPAILGASTEGQGLALSAAPGAKEMMLGTADEPGLFTVGAKMFRHGLFPPNPRSALCSPRYCARWANCKFHE